MDEPFLGCILPWTMNFAPAGWAFCNGQTMQVQGNQALYSIIGVAFGGTPNSTFNLPNLNGRFPRGMSHTVPDTLGAVGGAKTVTLGVNNLPAHTHALGPIATAMPSALNSATTGTADTKPPTANYKFGTTSAAGVYTTGAVDTPIAGLTVTTTGALANAGSPAPISVMPPYQAINFIICISGYYPQRP